ncbi:MAG: efflux RND transporter periplasmic adaptor subunit [Bacteroidia bacterium]|nr:efflux RND transporter periplasmic adaptor subunit [Bacteroidia bacterium]
MIKKIIFTVSALALLVFVFVKLASNKKEINAAAAYKETKENIAVEVITAQRSTYYAALQYTGTFKPFKETNFGAESQGKLTEVYIEEGDYVKSGQLLAKINDELLSVKLAAEQAQLEKAKVDLERQKNLSKDNATTDAMLKQMELGYALAQTAVASTQKQIAMTRITAPISGLITMETIEKGSIVAPGVPLGTITDVSQLKLEVLIPENQIKTIKKGSRITVMSDVYPDQIFTGTINLIAVKGDQNHNFKVEILVANSNSNFPLKAGMFASIQANSSEQVTNFLIPRSAVVNQNGETKVFVAQNGKAVARTIQTNGLIDDNMQVISGIEEGEQVIITGVNNLKDGITIKIK